MWTPEVEGILVLGTAGADALPVCQGGHREAGGHLTWYPRSPDSRSSGSSSVKRLFCACGCAGSGGGGGGPAGRAGLTGAAGIKGPLIEL